MPRVGSASRNAGAMRRLLLSLAFAGMIMPFAVAFAQSDRQALFRETARRLDLQTEMPGEVAKPQDWGPQFEISSDFVQLLLWGAVVLGVAVVVWSLRDSLPVFSRSRRIVAPPEAIVAAGSGRQMHDAQVEADDLAAQGYYNEAMHVLLHKSLQELHHRLGLRFSASLTSREILRRVELPDDGRGALTRIIQAVEMTYFGGRQADAADYSQCRGHFDIFRRTLGGPARA